MSKPLDRLSLSLPLPPSANHLWRWTKRGRCYNSEAYATWLTQCRVAVGPGRLPQVRTPARVTLEVSGVRVNSDLDNRVKPVLDLLRHLGVIPDDTVREIVEIQARYVPGGSGVVVTLEAMDNDGEGVAGE